MTDITNTTMTSVRAAQNILAAATALSLTAWRFPSSVDIDDGFYCDFVVAGSGAGGSTLASRLSEDPDITVCLFEAGGVPPIESTNLGLFTMAPSSSLEWNIEAYNDGFANQFLQNNVVATTAGKVLGGSSSIDHGIGIQPNKYDWIRFANATGDSTYTSGIMQNYTKMIENVVGASSNYSSYYGTEGPLTMIKESYEENNDILNAFKELGLDITYDAVGDITQGIFEPFLIKTEVYRQSAADSYLGLAKKRSNLHVMMNTLVTKININDSMVATGIEVLTSDGTTKTINARKEVIVSCGALRTPQLLMLSGIGNKTHLAEFNIEGKVDLPVGEDLLDHPSNVVVIKLQESNTTAVSNPTVFPVPVTTSFASFDGTDDPDYQSINLVFSNAHAGLSYLCVNVFDFNASICQPMSDANEMNTVMYSVVNLMHPKSRGQVSLASSDPSSNPKVELRHLSEESDLIELAKASCEVMKVVNTTTFKNMNASVVEFDLPQCAGYERYSDDFCKCYARCLSSTMWHYSSTCAPTKVVETDFTVKGISNLRIADASVLPYTVTGNIIQGVYAMAELIASLTKTKWGLS